MLRVYIRRAVLILAASMILSSAYAAQIGGVGMDRGFYLAPVTDLSPVFISGDAGQPQTFEIIRPRGEPITIGRLHTSCGCVQLEAPKRTFAQGERAILTLRNVRPTPPNGLMYSVYVQLTSPINTTLRQDTFVQSDQFRQPPAYNTYQTGQNSYYRR